MIDMEAQRRRVAVLCSHIYPSFNNSRNSHIVSTSNCSSQSTSQHQIRDLVDNPNSHEDCVFCQIIRGNSSSFKLYEDDMCLCILDTSPLSRGHSLLIPKRHFHSLDATPPSVIIYSSPSCPFPVDGMIFLLAAFSELFRNTKSLFASIASLYPFPRSSQVIAAMFSKIPFISNAIKKATGCDSFNLLVNNGAAAGQVIFHTHIHVIPRKAHDRLWASESLRRLSLKLDQEAPHLAESIREQLLIENNKEECEDQGSVLAGKL